MKITTTRTLLAIAIICFAVSADAQETPFEDPVFLKVGDDPMNQDGSLMYPSPVIFDVDNDGQDELVIGTIFGQLVACENSNPESGMPVWGAPEEIKSLNDEPLKLNNW